MKTVSEKLLEKKLREAVTNAGGLAVKLVAVSFTGLPDRLVLLPGARICFVEVKSTGKGLKPRQKIIIPMLEKLGFKVWIVDSEETLKEFKKSL